MQIKLGTLALIGGGYLVGYTRGMQASESLGKQIAHGLTVVGEGLKEMSVAIGVEYRKDVEADAQILRDDLTIDEKINVLADRNRTREMIADKLDISIEEVERVLGKAPTKESVVDSTVEEDKPVSGVLHHPTPEEAFIGESPTDPGSDAT